MAVDIEQAAQLLEGRAAAVDNEASGLFKDADNLVAAAKVAAENIIAEAKTRADGVRDQARGKQEEAEYWRDLAARERQNAGSRVVTRLRYCNGCGQSLQRDLTHEESEAAAAGAPLPDTRAECPTCSSAAAQQAGSHPIPSLPGQDDPTQGGS
ncbi:hypothetical protein ACRYCC_26025 [Actinomadura scrupuli]|uniref:hypothetical protein n=1 Tax=Actinomadura scrupuli TaxID=559629 RepID=UPI003D9723CE